MPIPPSDKPLIVTALLDTASAAKLEALRTRHFPPALNRVPAHVSLFHHLPADETARVCRDAAGLCDACQPFALHPTGARFLGRGVAIDYASEELSRLRHGLAALWSSWLIPQDRQPFKPHVTIQNKVTPAEAKALLASLDPAAWPACRVEGLMIWRYLGGPWRAEAEIRFPVSTG